MSISHTSKSSPIYSKIAFLGLHLLAKKSHFQDFTIYPKALYLQTSSLSNILYHLLSISIKSHLPSIKSLQMHKLYAHVDFT